MYSVLIVDDDRKLLDILKTYFLKEHFIVYTAVDGLDALSAVKEHSPSVIILDLMLPKLDGYEVCRRIRQNNNVPIIMLTARDDETDRLVGLGIGADDYVTKPFSMRELVARVRALLRRSYENIVAAPQILHSNGLELDLSQHIAKRDDDIIELTPIEFNLLEIFMKNPKRVFNRLQLMENTHGFAFDGYERTIDGHIRNLRRKIEPNTKKPQYILTVYGIGYKFGGV